MSTLFLSEYMVDLIPPIRDTLAIVFSTLIILKLVTQIKFTLGPCTGFEETSIGTTDIQQHESGLPVEAPDLRFHLRGSRST